MQNRSVGLIVVISLFLMSFSITYANTLEGRNFRQSDNPLPESGSVQEFTNSVADDAVVYYDLFNMQAGQTLYIYVEAVSGDVDMLIAVGDIDFEEILDFDENSADGTQARLAYEIPETNDYSIAIASIPDVSSGEFRLLMGIDTPEVLNGTVTPTGTPFAVLFGDTAPPVTEYDCDNPGERPELSGTVLTYETENFIIHYTLEGRDGATPLFIEDVAEAVEKSWAFQIETMGWAMPPQDCGEGGDTRFDVYVSELISGDESILGFAMPEQIIRDNPTTERVEGYAAYSYLSIDNNFYFGGDQALARRVMRSTVAHEINHNIQFGYDFADAYAGFYESTAVWMESRTYEEESDFVGYVENYFNTSDVCLGGEAEGDTNFRVYGEWFLLESLSMDYGDDAIIGLWEHLIDDEGLAGFYRGIEKLDTTIQQVVLEAATRNLLHDYSTAIASRFNDRVRVESNLNAPGQVVPRRDGVQQLGADFIRVGNKQRYEFAINDPDLQIRFVGTRSDGQADVIDPDSAGKLVVDTTAYVHAYVIVFNTRTHETVEDCAFSPWELTATANDSDPLTVVLNSRTVPNFNPAG